MDMNWLKNKTKNFRENNHFKKNHNYKKNILKEENTYDAQLVFNPTTLSWLFVIVTLFLQIISLATTYAGSKVYFGGIKLPYGISAPMLFAFSIQVTVFALSNSLKKNFRSWVVASLLFATMCSTYFSYIGIYNYINSPIQYLEERYIQVFDNLNKEYTTIVDTAKNNMKQYVFDITNNLQREYTSLTKKHQENTALNEKVQKVELKDNIVVANTGNIAKPNINNYGDNLDQYYKDMASYSTAISNSVGQASQANSTAQSTLYENEIKIILGGTSLEDFTKTSIEVQSKKELLESQIISMSGLTGNASEDDFTKRLTSLQQYCLNYINTGKGNRETFNTVITNMFTIYSDISSSNLISGFKDALNSFLSVSDNTKIFMKSVEDIKLEVYLENYGVNPTKDAPLQLADSMLLYSKLHSEIKMGAYIINSFKGDETFIDTTNSEYILDNMYVLPMKNLFTRNENLAMSWFCFAFAALIDGLTLLFALMHRKNNSVLFANQNSDLIKKNAEFTEELLLSSLILHPIDNEHTDTIELSLEHLANFLLSFNVTNIAMEHGYSLYAPLEKLDDYQIFLSVLCQFNFAKIISQDDFELLESSPSMSEIKEILKKEENIEPQCSDSTNSIARLKSDRKFLLLKTKFVIWTNQKFSIASSNKNLSEVLLNILKNIDYTNYTSTKLEDHVYDSEEVV